MAKAEKDIAPPDLGAEAPPRRDADKAPPSLAAGIAVIQAQRKTMPSTPGVYRMLDRRGDAVYVGKAQNLRKRVVAYTTPSKLPYRLQRMVAETAAMEVVQTHTEVEALLLESNLIKRLRPRYNVLLRDDKSFPYILITSDHEWPRIVKYRGSRSAGGRYYGPFASAGAVNRTLNALQRAFLLRSCSDSVFSSRTRPCLLYQIKRCSGPCVGRVDRVGYDALVHEAQQFLEGRTQRIQRQLAARMQTASEEMEYEKAAAYRDRIRALTAVQSHQGINVEGIDEADVLAAHQEGGQTCVQVFFFRSGRNYGNRAYFPRHDRETEVEDVLGAFIGQFYEDKPVPRQVLLSHRVPEQALLAEALAVRAERAVKLFRPERGEKRRMVDHARLNAREALARRMAESASQNKALEGLADIFDLDGPPRRIEVYDNSHIGGSHPYGAMIVAGPEGMMKNAYRKFSIRGAAKPSTAVKSAPGLAEAQAGYAAPIRGGDDYAMMREVLTRRFERAIKEDPERERGVWPDLVVIDGGQGQLGVAEQVFAELGIEDVELLAIAKGPDRNAGRERFFRPGKSPRGLEPRDPVLYFLQRLRDEAHRFAIGTHRARRSKAIGTSPLDEVPGIGPRRKRALLHHFGSARGV
ncbi:MAG: excinuclease ABC subunit UvrC, partial [Rhodospirillaceae bacterium]|nr:excinuclease ABC subunit UvrC [Rhodospirillaceae bacterium]